MSTFRGSEREFSEPLFKLLYSFAKHFFGSRILRNALALSTLRSGVTQWRNVQNLQNMKEQASARCVSTGATTQDNNSLRAMKARQTRKIEQLREVLFANRRLRVREQAELLGLCRSTAHAVLQRSYKHSGLSAAIIKRMLACPNLPDRARTIVIEYNAEKIGGLYGHTPSQRRRFMAALAMEQNRASKMGRNR